MISLSRYLLIIIAIIAVSCNGSYKLVKHSATNIPMKGDSLMLYDSATADMIAPYKLKLDGQMNEVIGTAVITLNRSMPDGSLGNLVADATLSYAAKNNDQVVDFCVLNAGGIRIPSIQQGNITVGKVYELMPFDNMIDIVEMDGKACMDLFRWIVKWKGAPVSGVAFTISGGEPVAITVNGRPFDSTATYRVATSDFVANGGDGATMFAGKNRTSTNFKIRDAVIEYIKTLQTINGDNYGRIKQN